MTRKILCTGALLAAVAAAACGSEPGPTEPEGAYLAFRQALLSGRPPELWSWISEDTKQIYRDALVDLDALSESVRLLSPADRAVAYERTAVRLADVVDSGEELFDELIRLENLVGDDRYAMGTEIEEIQVTESEERATVTTVAGQTFELVREEDGIWRVSSLQGFAREQLENIAESVTAVDILAAESAYMRRSHAEIVRLLGGAAEPEGTGEPAEGSGGP